MRSEDVTLVLGAGGDRGWDWILGCLLALESELGFEPSRSRHIVGTSVGSLVGAYLRHGVSTERLCRHVGGAPSPRRPTHPVHDADLATRRWHRPVDAIRRAVAQGFGLGARRDRGLASVGDELVRRLGSSTWPDGDFSAVAWDRRRRERAVIDQSSELALGQAIDASCAVPGVYPPVSTKGADLVDGGIHSVTNADLAAGGTVIVIAPMAMAAGRPQGIGEVAPWAHRIGLARELRDVPAERVFAFVPSRAARGVLAGDDRRQRIAVARGEAEAVLSQNH